MQHDSVCVARWRLVQLISVAGVLLCGWVVLRKSARVCHIPDENWVKMRNCNEPHSIIGCGMNGTDRKLILWP